MLDPAAVADAVVYAVTRPADVGIPNLLIGRG
jgi:NADP-dependent 3-hydroxy acid dehydrogenase YdfG